MAGKVPEQEIPIVFTGLRPGEKLFEELLTEDEEETQQVRNRIKVAKSPPPPKDLEERLRDLRAAADTGDREAVLRGIEGLVPTYRRTPNGKADLAAESSPDLELADVLQLRPAMGDR
jgi:FlaA1/EpsC-like NDP-sugar epimerase